jgi:hypothetical protein
MFGLCAKLNPSCVGSMLPTPSLVDITLTDQPIDVLGSFHLKLKNKKKCNVTWSMSIEVQYLLDDQSFEKASV